MNEYESMMLHAAKRDDLLRAAERERLATIARGETRRFRLFSWRLPVIRLNPPASKSNSRREVTRAIAPY